jgi:hypothetical protein
MRAVRAVLGVVGVLLVLVGVHRLLVADRPDLPDLLDVALFLAAGVLVHDVVLAPLVVVAGALLLPRLPGPARAPAAVGLVVLLSVTLVAVPVLGRFGAKADDPWLLDRPYGLLWLGLAVVVALVVLVATLLRRRSGRPS